MLKATDLIANLDSDTTEAGEHNPISLLDQDRDDNTLPVWCAGTNGKNECLGRRGRGGCGGEVEARSGFLPGTKVE